MKHFWEGFEKQAGQVHEFLESSAKNLRESVSRGTWKRRPHHGRGLFMKSASHTKKLTIGAGVVGGLYGLYKAHKARTQEVDHAPSLPQEEYPQL